MDEEEGEEYLKNFYGELSDAVKLQVWVDQAIKRKVPNKSYFYITLEVGTKDIDLTYSKN